MNKDHNVCHKKISGKHSVNYKGRNPHVAISTEVSLFRIRAGLSGFQCLQRQFPQIVPVVSNEVEFNAFE